MDDETPTQAAKGALLDLIEVEARIEAELASAAAEAEQIVEAARAEAQALRGNGDAEVEAELQKLRASIDRECEATIQELEDRAHAEEQRYAGVGNEELLELARWVAAQLVGIGSPP